MKVHVVNSLIKWSNRRVFKNGVNLGFFVLIELMIAVDIYNDRVASFPIELFCVFFFRYTKNVFKSSVSIILRSLQCGNNLHLVRDYIYIK